ncbi:hypothetical protein K402DRAFT_401295 [Aulographum hederae CBS 113979]|uniref:Uncharacterized protein n=1 Tax=Aulographum hederae CBS 113979 TaxID=1176131 RepID=A0A6G1HB65_9PEZI|nr:hypothetical protein K402DRAFT_401295 [Aulographum hederae CBS 113979]
MAPDRPGSLNRDNNQPPRPLMPTLASNRTPKTPLTPRLATQHSSSSSSLKKPPSRSEISGIAKPVAADSAKSPLYNVTPRSSSRKSRVDSANSTPGGTPDGTPSGVPLKRRPMSTIEGSMRGGVGLGIRSAADASTGSRRPLSIFNANITGQSFPTARSAGPSTSRGSSEVGGDRTNLFIHASDAKSPPQETRPPMMKKTPTFVYANGEQERANSEPPPPIPSPPLSGVGSVRSNMSKFFHADGTEDEAVASPSGIASPEMFPSIDAIHNPLSLRPPSPNKALSADNIHLSYRKGASQVIRPSIHRPLPSPSPPKTSFDVNRARRRSSAETAPTRMNHAKTSSLSSIDSGSAVSTGRSRQTSVAISTPGAERILSPSTPTPPPALNTSGPRNFSRPTAAPQLRPLSTDPILPSQSESEPALLTSPQSPIKASFPSNQTELANNARRERKVLDLEISNSSLLAINRQLEREVRRQKADLRRFRRLSRAGRLSLGTRASSLGADGDLEVLEEEDELTALSSDLEDLSEEEEEEDSSDDSFASSAMSPSALKERDAKHLARDEKRLRLDLSKHKELLVDSQKMNQSLKRCLGWTEELIKEGKKALEYKVRVSDVKLGGRILTPEEVEMRKRGLDVDIDVDGGIDAGGGVEYSPDINDPEDEDEGEERGTDRAEELKEEIAGLLGPWQAAGRSMEAGREDKDSGVNIAPPPPYS